MTEKKINVCLCIRLWRWEEVIAGVCFLCCVGVKQVGRGVKFFLFIVSEILYMIYLEDDETI